MWNYYFLLWEREEEKQKKIDFYKKSLKIYLQIFENLKENDEKKENIGKNIQIIKSKIFQKNDEKIEENKEIKKDENKIFEEIKDEDIKKSTRKMTKFLKNLWWKIGK